MGKKTLNQVNNVLICSLVIVYLTYLSFMRKTKLIGLLVGVYLSAYLVTRNHLSSSIIAIILALSMEVMLKSYETWGENINIGTGRSFNTNYQNLSDTVESFKGKSKKRRRRRKKVENFDDEVNESYIDLGSSFLEAYKSLTPRQIEKMSSDTRSLMGHQQKLIETLDNLGPVIKGGKQIMEQFKHYFKDEI